MFSDSRAVRRSRRRHLKKGLVDDGKGIGHVIAARPCAELGPSLRDAWRTLRAATCDRAEAILHHYVPVDEDAARARDDAAPLPLRYAHAAAAGARLLVRVGLDARAVAPLKPGHREQFFCNARGRAAACERGDWSRLTSRGDAWPLPRPLMVVVA